MVVSWLHKRIKENHTKVFRGDEIPNGHYSQMAQEGILYAVLASFLSICDVFTERERSDWYSEGPCTASGQGTHSPVLRYCCCFLGQERL